MLSLLMSSRDPLEGRWMLLGSHLVLHFAYSCRWEAESAACENVCRDVISPTNIAPSEASHTMDASRHSSRGWHRGGLQGGPLEGLHRLATSEPTLSSPDPPLCLLTLCFTGSGSRSVNFISLVTSCIGLREEEPQIALPHVLYMDVSQSH